MNHTEATKLVAIITSLCPSQKFNRSTPDAWAIVMDDIDYQEAQTAVKVIYRTQGSDQEWSRKIEADDIIRQVNRTHTETLAKADFSEPPPDQTPERYMAWLRETNHRLARGLPVEMNTRGELKPRPTIGILAGRRMEDA